MELELRHLKTVRAIADAGSLTRAATALGLAQPALSAQLKRIERALGGALFERGRHGVRATALGELVLERSRIVLPAVSELQREAARFARAPRTTDRLRLGGTHGPLLGALVDRLADVSPHARMTTCTSWSERELAHQLGEGRLDFALTGTCGSAAPPAAEDLVWQEVAVDPVFVMLSEAHPLAGRGELALPELAEEEWACVPGDGCFGDCFTAACARAGFTPRRLYETDTASLVHLVQVGRAIGLCRATFPTTPGIVTRPLTDTPLAWRHLLGRHAATQPEDTAATVLTQARLAHADVAAGSDSYTEWLAARDAEARDERLRDDHVRAEQARLRHDEPRRPKVHGGRGDDPDGPGPGPGERGRPDGGPPHRGNAEDTGHSPGTEAVGPTVGGEADHTARTRRVDDPAEAARARKPRNGVTAHGAPPHGHEPRGAGAPARRPAPEPVPPLP